MESVQGRDIKGVENLQKCTKTQGNAAISDLDKVLEMSESLGDVHDESLKIEADKYDVDKSNEHLDENIKKYIVNNTNTNLEAKFNEDSDENIYNLDRHLDASIESGVTE